MDWIGSLYRELTQHNSAYNPREPTILFVGRQLSCGFTPYAGRWNGPTNPVKLMVLDAFDSDGQLRPEWLAELKAATIGGPYRLEDEEPSDYPSQPFVWRGRLLRGASLLFRPVVVRAAVTNYQQYFVEVGSETL